MCALTISSLSRFRFGINNGIALAVSFYAHYFYCIRAAAIIDDLFFVRKKTVQLWEVALDEAYLGEHEYPNHCKE